MLLFLFIIFIPLLLFFFLIIVFIAVNFCCVEEPRREIVFSLSRKWSTETRSVVGSLDTFFTFVLFWPWLHCIITTKLYKFLYNSPEWDEADASREVGKDCQGFQDAQHGAHLPGTQRIEELEARGFLSTAKDNVGNLKCTVGGEQESKITLMLGRAFIIAYKLCVLYLKRQTEKFIVGALNYHTHIII